MLRNSMSKLGWIGPAAAVLLWTTMAAADGVSVGANVQVGSGGVDVQVQGQPASEQPTLEPPAPDQPAPTEDPMQAGPHPGVDVQVQPGHVQVESNVGPHVGVQVQPGNVHVFGRIGRADAGGVMMITLGEYWLGVECQPLGENDPLRAQLDLPAQQGMLVTNVSPESPAAVAGIQKYDVLLKVGDKPLGQVKDLLDAINASEGKEMVIELLRGGKPKVFGVTPAKRPAEAQPSVAEPPKDWQGWFERVRPDGVPGGFRFRFFHPGAILPRGAAVQEPSEPMPADLSIAINKQGDEPAKITVKKGDQKWEVAENELDKLPEDIRPHVARMLGRVPSDNGGDVPRLDFIPEWPMPGQPEGQVPDKLEFRPAAPEKGPVEKRLEEMNHRLEQLRKSVEELREKNLQKVAPEKSPNQI